MLDVKDKKGQLLVCQDRECGHRKRLVSASKTRERRENDGGVSKKEVAKFLQQQQQSANEEGSTNSALADALAKWKTQQEG
jgi:DNA topoisomerase-3